MADTSNPMADDTSSSANSPSEGEMPNIPPVAAPRPPIPPPPIPGLASAPPRPPLPTMSAPPRPPSPLSAGKELGDASLVSDSEGINPQKQTTKLDQRKLGAPVMAPKLPPMPMAPGAPKPPLPPAPGGNIPKPPLPPAPIVIGGESASDAEINMQKQTTRLTPAKPAGGGGVLGMFGAAKVPAQPASIPSPKPLPVVGPAPVAPPPPVAPAIPAAAIPAPIKLPPPSAPVMPVPAPIPAAPIPAPVVAKKVELPVSPIVPSTKAPKAAPAQPVMVNEIAPNDSVVTILSIVLAVIAIGVAVYLGLCVYDVVQ